jgi:hypothetical protein
MFKSVSGHRQSLMYQVLAVNPLFTVRLSSRSIDSLLTLQCLGNTSELFQSLSGVVHQYLTECPEHFGSSILQKDTEWFEKYGSVVQLRGPLMVCDYRFSLFSATRANSKDTRNRFSSFKTPKRSITSIKVSLVVSRSIERRTCCFLLSWVMGLRQSKVSVRIFFCNVFDSATFM